jgi:hypothetical protein
VSGEPNYSVDFISRMVGSERCAIGDCLVYDTTEQGWRVANAANRASANAGTQAVAITAWGVSIIGQVSVQASATVAQEISGLAVLTPTTTKKLVRTSSTGRLERIDAYTTGDDVVGYATWDGRVALHLGLPWEMISALAGGFAAGGDLTGTSTSQTVAKIQGVAISGTAASGKTLVASGAAAASWQTPSSGASPAGATGDIQVKQDATTFNVVGHWKAVGNAGKLRATYWDDADGVTIRAGIEVSAGTFNDPQVFPDFGLIRLSSVFYTTGGWSLLTITNPAGTSEWGLLGTSGGRFFIGNPDLVVPTDIYGNGITISGGATGITQGNTTVSGNITVTSNATVSGVLTATTLGPAAGTLTLRQKTTSQLGANTGVSTTDSFDDFARVQTTDATTTNLYTFTLPTNAVTTIDIRVTACQNNTSSADAWVGTATFKNAAGTVATVAAANITHRGSTAWTVTIDNSTTTARVRVTGAAATTIEWAVEISYQVTRQS